MSRTSTLPLLENLICADDDTRAAVEEAFCGKGKGEKHDSVVKKILTPGHPPLPDLSRETGCPRANVYKIWHAIRDFCVGRFLFRSCRRDIFSPQNTTALLLEIVPCSSIPDKFEKISQFADELSQQIGWDFMLGDRQRRQTWVEQICANWRDDDRELAEMLLDGQSVDYAACRHNCPVEAVNLLKKHLCWEIMIKEFWEPFDELVGRGVLRTIRVTVKYCDSVDERIRIMKDNLRSFCETLFTPDYIASAGGGPRRRRQKATKQRQ